MKLSHCFLGVIFFFFTGFISPAFPATVPNSRFAGKNYSLAFHDDGRVDIFFRDGKSEVLAGTVGAFEFPAGKIRTAGKVVIDTAMRPVSDKEKVNFENIATALEVQKSGWPQVNVQYKLEGGSLTAQWTLMPDMVRVQFQITPAKEDQRVDGPAVLGFQMADKTALAEQIKPARWYRHPLGGVPYQLTAGMADRYTLAQKSFIIANDHGLPQVYDPAKKQISLFVRNVKRPWLTDQLQGNLVFSFSRHPAAMDLAVAAAGEDRLMMVVKSPDPFYLWNDAQKPIVLKACLANLNTKPERVEVEYLARDMDGKIIAQGQQAQRLEPLNIRELPIQISPKDIGPIFLEIQARHSRAAVFENITVGVMADRKFLDGENSRFGVAAYRGEVGMHTELRSEPQLLEFMRKIGVRWLRASGDHLLAQKYGFYTWYQNGPYGPAADDYFKGKPSWMNEPANRENFLKGNLQWVIDKKDVCLEFTNEWNLFGGENNGVLAEKLAKDWMIPLKKLRDQMVPKVKLAGCIIANGDLVFLDKIHKAGAWDSFDILAVHAACCPRTPDLDDGNTYWSYLATLRRVHEAMRKYGKKELWMTEMYAPTAPNSACSLTERQAADDITLMFGLAVAADVRGVMFYCLDDFDHQEEIKTARDLGEPTEREDYFGIIRRDWMPKAGLWSYQTAAWLFDGAKFIGDIVLPDKDLRGLLFETPKGKLALLWSRKEGFQDHGPSHTRFTHLPPWIDPWSVRTPLTIRTEKSQVRIFDSIGREKILSPDQSKGVTVELSGSPVYILGGKFKTYQGHFSKIFIAP
jgi:hypothetical protein